MSEVRPAVCPECQVSFEATHKLRQFCSDRCRYRNRDSRPHRREYDNQRHRSIYASDPHAYNASHPRRPKARADLYGAEYEPIDPQQVFERDGWMCGICSEPVDEKLVHPDPMCASIDHVIPWTAGGNHLLINVQCSHLVCNLRKGAKVLEPGAP